MDSQCIVAEIQDMRSHCKFLLSLVYAFNTSAEPMCLWEVLTSFKRYRGPWVVCGDFNNVLFLNERLGAEVHVAEIEPFKKCVQECDLVDIKSTGTFFTWNSKQARINRVIFDHCPYIVQSAGVQLKKPCSFKYYNMWSMAPEFKRIIKERWCMGVGRHAMFQVVHKMKILKKDLRALNKGLFSNVEHSADMALQLLHLRQTELQANPSDMDLLLAEREAATSARFLLEAKHRFLVQR
ncbi:hypothetical protein vseg_007410 [Gypsophila vaccaria]